MFSKTVSRAFVICPPCVADTKMTSVAGWPSVYVLVMHRILTVLHHGSGHYLVEDTGKIITTGSST